MYSRCATPPGVREVRGTGLPPAVALPESEIPSEVIAVVSVTFVGEPCQREKRSSGVTPLTGQVWSAYSQPPGPLRTRRWYGRTGRDAGLLTSGPGSFPPGSTEPMKGIRIVCVAPPAFHEISAFRFASTRRTGFGTFVPIPTEAGAAGTTARAHNAAMRIGSFRTENLD